MEDLQRRSFLKLTGAAFATALTSGVASLTAGNRIVVPTELLKPVNLLGPVDLNGFRETPELRSAEIQPLVTFHGSFEPQTQVSSIYFNIKDFPLRDHLYETFEGVTHRRIEFYNDGQPFRISDYNARGKLHGYRMTLYKGAELLVTSEQIDDRNQLCRKQILPNREIGGFPIDCVIRIPAIYIDKLKIAPRSFYFAQRQVANRWRNGIVDGDEFCWNLNAIQGHRLQDDKWHMTPVHAKAWTKTTYEMGQAVGDAKLYAAVVPGGMPITYRTKAMTPFHR